MTDKFQNKYRIPSARATWWNYANNAGYFVTLCTKNREHYFGEIGTGNEIQPIYAVRGGGNDVDVVVGVVDVVVDVETQCIASLPIHPNAAIPIHPNASIPEQPPKKPIASIPPQSNPAIPIHPNASIPIHPNASIPDASIPPQSNAAIPMHPIASIQEKPPKKPIASIPLQTNPPISTQTNASIPPQPPTAFWQPTEIGKIVESEWLKTPSIRPDMHLELDEFVVMPNHFHAIIWIGINDYNRNNIDIVAGNGIGDNDIGDDGIVDNDIVDNVETPCMASLPMQPMQPMQPIHPTHPTHPTHPMQPMQPTASINKFGPQYKNLSSVLRGFKSAVTTFARKNHLEFDWQERFYDHIIRDEDSYQRIKNYILNNQSNWKTDKFYN